MRLSQDNHLEKTATTAAASRAGGEEGLLEALEEFRAALDRGEVPDRAAILARHSDVAEELSACLDSLDFITNVAPQLGQAAGEHDPERDGESHAPAAPVAGVLGDFRLLREIGRGGMGVVYEAQQISLGRRVALKVLPFAAMLDKQQLKRFANEARAAATLDHPNIVQVYFVGSDRGVHFYAMQLIEGQSLAEVIEGIRNSEFGIRKPDDDTETVTSDLRIPTSEFRIDTVVALTTQRETNSPAYFRTVARLGIQAAEALDHAHSQGVIHRDIKPANLLIDEDGNLHVTDFGLARIEADAGMTMTGDLLGTLRYMSPEQASGKRGVIDHRADVYALGVTLYELLTLQPAYGESDRQMLLRQIATEEPRLPRRINSSIPIELETIVLKASQRDPDDRYQAARQLANDLQCFLDHRPIAASRPTPIERLRKWIRRHPSTVVSVMTVLSILTLAAISAFWLIAQAYDRENDYRLRAQEDAAEAVAARGRETIARDDAEHEREVSQQSLYFAHIRLAMEHWRVGNVARMRELLEKHRPKPGQVDRRRWEWYYLSELCCHDPIKLKPHGGIVQAVSWSPRGNILATGGGDSIVRLHDTSSGKTIVAFSGHRGALVSIAWSPDGKRLATGDIGGAIMIWDVENKRPEKLLAEGATNRSPTLKDRVWSLSWHPKNDWLVAVTNGEAVVWDLKSWSVAFKAHDRDKRCIKAQWSPDGDRLATLELDLVKSIETEFDKGQTPADDIVIVWRADDGSKIRSWSTETIDQSALSWSPDGKQLATGGFTRVLKIWDVETGAEVRQIPHSSGIESIAWSPNGDDIASATRSQRVRVWNATTGGEVVSLRGHTDWVVSVEWSPSGDRIASGARDGQVRIWNPLRQPGVQVFDHRDGKYVSFNPVRNQLASSCRVDSKIWDLTDGSLVRHVNSAIYAVWHPDGRRLVTGTERSGKFDIVTFDIHEGKVDREILQGLAKRLAVSPNGKYVAVADRIFVKDAERKSRLGTIEIWDLAKGEQISQFTAHLSTASKVWDIQWSPDGRRLASSGWDGLVKIWDPFQGAELVTLKGHMPNKWVRSVAWSPDGAKIASVGFDQLLMIWDTKTGLRLQSLKGHIGAIWTVAWSPDGARIATAGYMVRVWDASTGYEILALKNDATESTFFGLAWDNDGRRLAAATDRGKVIVWDATHAYDAAKEKPKSPAGLNP